MSSPEAGTVGVKARAWVVGDCPTCGYHPWHDFDPEQPPVCCGKPIPVREINPAYRFSEAEAVARETAGIQTVERDTDAPIVVDSSPCG